MRPRAARSLNAAPLQSGPPPERSGRPTEVLQLTGGTGADLVLEATPGATLGASVAGGESRAWGVLDGARSVDAHECLTPIWCGSNTIQYCSRPWSETIAWPACASRPDLPCAQSKSSTMLEGNCSRKPVARLSRATQEQQRTDRGYTCGFACMNRRRPAARGVRLVRVSPNLFLARRHSASVLPVGKWRGQSRFRHAHETACR